MSDCWKLTLHTSAPEAAEAALENAGVSAIGALPRIDDDSGLYDRLEPDAPHTLEAYFDFEPQLRHLQLPEGTKTSLEKLPNTDWVTQSQKNLAPVHVPPFYVHGAHDRVENRGSRKLIEMDAGLAFGSGHHGTTQGCLALFGDHLRRAMPRHVADIGCGSGTLAIAAAKVGCPHIIASDNDLDAVKVTPKNARLNAVAPQIEAILATGMAHPKLRNHGPYDLIFANILARPLHALVGDFNRALAPQGRLILSGLLHEHARPLLARYRQHGFYPEKQRQIGAWTSLLLRR
jgi:ribosomal protein L11 methyltransferase